MAVNPNTFPKYVYKADGTSLFCPSYGFFLAQQNPNWYSDSPSDFITLTPKEIKKKEQCRECMQKDVRIEKLKKEVKEWEVRFYSRVEKYLGRRLRQIIDNPEKYTKEYIRIAIRQFKKYDKHVRGWITPQHDYKSTIRNIRVPKNKIDNTNGEN